MKEKQLEEYLIVIELGVGRRGGQDGKPAFIQRKAQTNNKNYQDNPRGLFWSVVAT